MIRSLDPMSAAISLMLAELINVRATRMDWCLPWYSLPPESSFCFVVVITKRGFQNLAGWHSRTSGSIDIREKRTYTSGISFLIVNYVTKLHVGFVSLGTAARL
jgi:hypothetical protein